MKVCMVAYTFYEGDNRVRRYAETLVKRGDSVDAIVLRQDGANEFQNVAGVNVYKIQHRNINEHLKIEYLLKLLLFLIKSFYHITRLHLKNKYDLIHVHSVPDFEVFAALVIKLTGAKIILDIHDIVPELFASKFNAKKDSLLFRMLLIAEKLSIAFSDHVIVANHIWYERLIQRSVKERKCTVVMNYPDTEMFRRTGKRNKKSENKFVMLYPGTLSIHQGLETAINAVELVKDKIPEIEFRIYGKGTDEEYFCDLVKNKGLQNRIYFNPIVPIEKLPEIICSADIGIEPKKKHSFGNEAFSTKILEFMAMGIPVIASDTMVHKHYFNEKMVKFFESENAIDLAEKILLLKKNERIRKALIINSLNFMERNNWEKKKTIYLNLVNRIVKNQKKYGNAYYGK
ncbi:MAG TPA: glycosyltransferase family 4 protein [Chitinispirillaceae bacterium]|nr:glycosyltransferase family 4 protein [Chitinispirillaceae bacterium]